ncbi:hypothetical protein HGM15179_018235 [Zosterops borbonicus]|uniref:Uncharacterized protein n=1 Tax=Zosterops borbonicus TaxID=364589 RepID=A0A8K1FZF6_9PASS|nr:hypothetical protein HGM15179_018235 [Zosterops borbonicus]
MNVKLNPAGTVESVQTLLPTIPVNVQVNLWEGTANRIVGKATKINLCLFKDLQNAFFKISIILGPAVPELIQFLFEPLDAASSGKLQKITTHCAKNSWFLDRGSSVTFLTTHSVFYVILDLLIIRVAFDPESFKLDNFRIHNFLQVTDE